MLPFPKSRFPTCSAYRFWNRLQKPYPACFLMPNSQLFSCRFRVIILWKFFNLCLVSSFSLLISFDFCSYPFIGNSRETSLYYYWKVANCLAGYFTRIFPNPLHYIWTLTNHFVGVFLKIFYTPSLLLESFKPFVGVFLKKFIKKSFNAKFLELKIWNNQKEMV